ncbi:MAG: hypothetical protein Q8O86_13310, partial [Dehalococcoidia bacterium]|nr:hypothetical protein [Dehalococcoidia bacterium]
LGKIDEACRIVRQSIVPALKEQQGFRGQFLLTQPETGKALSINLWETEIDLKAFESSATYRESLARLTGALAGPPAGEVYEVNVQP